MINQKSEKELLKEISNKLDKLIALFSIRSGLKKEEVAKLIGVTGRTLQNWFPIRKLQMKKRKKYGKIKSKDMEKISGKDKGTN